MKKNLKIHLHFDGELLCGTKHPLSGYFCETVSEYLEQCVLEGDVDEYYCRSCLKNFLSSATGTDEKVEGARGIAPAFYEIS